MTAGSFGRDRLTLLDVEAEKRGHPALADRHGLLHCLAAQPEQTRSIRDSERARCRQCGVFTERMPRHKSGIPGEDEAALPFEDTHHRETRRHQRRLRVLGQGELAFGPFEHELRQVLRQGVVDFLEDPARRRKRRRQSAPHADRLRALSRKHECPLHAAHVPLKSPSPDMSRRA